MSTQNGRNYFYTLWHAAETRQNIYAPFKVDWYQVPQYNPDTGQWEKRTEAWKEMMVGILGSEQAFYYQYGTQFLSSDKCLVSRETISRLRDNTYLFEKLEKICNDRGAKIISFGKNGDIKIKDINREEKLIKVLDIDGLYSDIFKPSNNSLDDEG